MHMPKSRIPILAFATATAAVGQMHSAQAQSTPGDAGASQIEELVITAQRREQRLQEVPVAVTALGANELERLQIRDTIDLINQVPNLVGNNNVGLGSSNTYFIRGIGNTESIATQDVPVGTYVDDVYISRQNANNFGLFDVERIEVLRGPQGTLFGRNTTGGAINIVMKKPQNQFGGYVEGAGGKYDQLDFRGTVDVPVNDTFLTKLSFFRLKSDGYATQVATGEKLNKIDSYGVRGAVRLLPSDTVSIDLTADLLDEDRANLLNVRGPNGDRLVITGIQQGALAPFFTGDKRFNEPGNQARTASGSINVQWELPFITLNSITGYRDTHQEYFIDSSVAAPNPNSPRGAGPTLNDGTHTQLSQELRATGKTLGDQIDYVFGLYYLDEDNETDLGQGTATATGFTVAADRTIDNTLETYAAYGQADYHFAQKFTATLGLRYTEETKELAVERNPGAQGAALSSAAIAAAGIPLELKEEFLTPRAALTYQYSPDLMFYVSATRGAKSGGWQGRATTNAGFLPFSPETVWSEEIGMRSSWLDGRLRLNVTGFYALTNDVQISSRVQPATGPAIFTTTNPADLKNYGTEIETIWAPTRQLTLTAAVGLQHARYTNISSDVQTQIALCQAALAAGRTSDQCNRGFVDFAGNIATPVRAPDFSMIGSASYDFNTPFGLIKPSASFNANDGYAIGNTGNPESTDGAWTRRQFMWNASLLIRPQALENLSLTLECENCSDQTYSVSFLSATSIYLNAPRTYSARLRYAF
jgi:iron complex outermembrane recepter protein